MNIVVLGAQGQMGSAIFKYLRQDASLNVIGTTRRSKPGLLTFDPFKDDWSRLNKVDVLINCIGIIQENGSETFERIHIDLVHLILQHSPLLGNPKVIQISALGASSDHSIKFLRTKGIADDLLMKNPDVAIIRPSIVCTPNTMIIQKLKWVKKIARYLGGCIIIPNGMLYKNIQPVMPEDLSDLVKVLCYSNHIQQIINLVGPEKLNYKQLFELLKMKNGNPYRLHQIPKKFMDLILRISIFHFCPRILTKEQYDLLFKDNISNKSLAEKLIGRPLLSTISFWKNQLH